MALPNLSWPSWSDCHTNLPETSADRNLKCTFTLPQASGPVYTDSESLLISRTALGNSAWDAYLLAATSKANLFS